MTRICLNGRTLGRSTHASFEYDSFAVYFGRGHAINRSTGSSTFRHLAALTGALRARARDGPSHRRACGLMPRLGKRAVSGWQLVNSAKGWLPASNKDFRCFRLTAVLLQNCTFFLDLRMSKVTGLDLTCFHTGATHDAVFGVCRDQKVDGDNA